jgi:hypothetical protein
MKQGTPPRATHVNVEEFVKSGSKEWLEARPTDAEG